MAGLAKSTPPRASRRLMRREPLMKRLVDARRQRCTVVLGQAGSGKTTTLLAWRRELMALDFDVAWLSLSAEDNDLQRFLRGLVASIASVDVTVADEAVLQTDGVGSDAEIEHWVISLVQVLAVRQRELVIMLEDLHQIRSGAIFQLIQRLLDYAPERLHLALSSRSALPLSLDRMRSRGWVTELDMRDLRFSVEESERYLLEQLGSIDERDAKALHELTDGWVAGLQLFALDLRAREGSDRARFAPVRVRDAQAFASYFEREVLVRLAAQDLDMLTRAAICSRFCAPLCGALLAEPQVLPRVRAMLARLHEDNFFISQIGSAEREPWYRLHPLLRETLLARLDAWPEGERRALHADACRWFSARGDVEDSVHHAVRAGNMDDAVAMVKASAHDLLSIGELPQLSGLLRQLPQEAIHQHFDLHLSQAYLAMYAREFDTCDASLRQMEARVEALDDRQRYDLLVLRCGLSVQQDRIDPVIARLPALIAIPPDAKDLAWTSRANILGWVHIHLGEHEQAQQVFEEARHRSGAQLSIQLGRCMAASDLAVQGRLGEAEQRSREVLRSVEQRGLPFGGVACVAASVLAGILYELDEVQAAQDLLEPRIAAIERLTLPEFVLRSLETLSNCHRWAGRAEAALAALDRLQAYALRYRFDRILGHALALKIRHHLRRGATGEAIDLAGQLDDLSRQHGGSGTVPGQLRECLARARIELALQGRDFAGASSQLAALVAAQPDPLHKGAAELQVQWAIACQAMGETEAGREHLLAGLKLGHRLGLLRSLVDVAPGLPGLLQGLLGPEALDPVLAFHVERLRASARTAAGRTPQAPPSQTSRATAVALSEREHEVLSLLAQAMPNKKIARMLNVTPDTVKYHLKNIYGKLGVSARDEAVARLRDLEASREAASGGS